MRLWAMAVLGILVSGQAAAQIRDVGPCLQPDAGEAGEPIETGDQWAQVRIAYDKRGNPTDCHITKTNITDRERRFWFCNAMIADWQCHPEKVEGKPVAGTTLRFLILRGRRHEPSAERAKADPPAN